MKRAIFLAILTLSMIGLFAANQASLQAKSQPAGVSATALDTMRTANQFYEEGQYAQAVQAYQQLVEQGYADSALFYNLGNATYKLGDYGGAILNYRRAQRLAPRDADIQANLDLARSRAVDQFEVTEARGTLTQLGETMQGVFTHDQLAMGALGLWILFVVLLLLFGTAKAGGAWRRVLKYAMSAAAVVLVAGVLALGVYSHADHAQSEGVIVVAQVEVTSGPGEQYVTEFTLHSGTEVDLVETRGSWVRLIAAGGELEGWVPVSAVEPVSG